ncbi:hypothetical protein CALCODRAFT_494476 [Calocera cornea HHB12733]|uniref:Uncharacterized protein n=1 Tax=Calocera cornea HHB12733 TaxID=1353952 RepID=A0A165H269_9BASI|nr:hypothetical protein CALCODRAFT_494476 [Calocera cornea HHB12733]
MVPGDRPLMQMLWVRLQLKPEGYQYAGWMVSLSLRTLEVVTGGVPLRYCGKLSFV